MERATGDSTTSSGIVRGTPAYMSPEQASGDHHLDGRTDQYSLACVVYEMLAGLPPFQGPTQESTIALRFRHPPREIRVYRPDVPPGLERVVLKAMSLSPADRYADMASFTAAFSAGEDRATELGQPRVRSLRRSIALVAAISAAVGLALYAAAHWF